MKSNPLVFVIALITVLPICTGADLPQKVTGQVVDAEGRPLKGVRVVLMRARQGDEPAEGNDITLPEEPEDEEGIPSLPPPELHEVGRAITDPMGYFSIRPTSNSRTHGAVAIEVSHRDYILRYGVVTRPDEMTIALQTMPIIDTVWRIRDEKTPEAAENLAAKMLRGDERHIWWYSWSTHIYPHLGSIRPTLLRIGTSGKFEDPMAVNRPSIGHRARMLLAYWADERDEEILQRWWKEREIKQADWPIPQGLRPDVEPAETLDEAIANWRKFVGVEDKGRGFISTDGEESPGRAFAHFTQFTTTETASLKWTIVFVKREGKWKTLFHYRGW